MNYILVPVEDVYKTREMMQWFVTPRKVHGTMLVHNVMVDEPGVSILVRRISCYDACCWDDDKQEPVKQITNCQHGKYGNWARNVLYTPAVYAKLQKKEEEYKKQQAELAKAGEQARRDAARLNARTEKYDVGDFVSVIWGDFWWIGQIQNEAVHQKYVVKFMHLVDKTDPAECKIDWPEDEDVEAVPVSDIMSVVSKPTKTLHGSRWCYTLPKKEVECVIDKFLNL